MGVAEGEVGADGAADGAARVTEALHADAVQRGEDAVGEVTDRGGRVRGGPAVPGQVVAEDAPVLGQLGYLAVPHVPGGAQGGADHQDRSVVGPVEAVLEPLGPESLRRLRAGAGLLSPGGLRLRSDVAGLRGLLRGSGRTRLRGPGRGFGPHTVRRRRGLGVLRPRGGRCVRRDGLRGRGVRVRRLGRRRRPGGLRVRLPRDRPEGRRRLPDHLALHGFDGGRLRGPGGLRGRLAQFTHSLQGNDPGRAGPSRGRRLRIRAAPTAMCMRTSTAFVPSEASVPSTGRTLPRTYREPACCRSVRGRRTATAFRWW